MSISRCPHCRLPMTEHEAAAGNCPSCGQGLAAALQNVAARGQAATRNSKPLFVVGGLALLTLIVGVIWYVSSEMELFSSSDSDRTEQPGPVAAQGHQNPIKPKPADEEKPALEPKVEEDPKIELPAPNGGDNGAAAKGPETPAGKLPPDDLLVKPKTTGPQGNAATVKGDGAKKNSTKVAPKPLPNPVPGPFVFPNPFDHINPMPKPKEPAGLKIKELNDPNAVFEAGNVLSGTKLKLKGKIGKLKVGEVNARALLDASELEAKEILIARPINGGSTVLLNAPQGNVIILAEINGESRLAINAPGGVVVFGDGSRPPGQGGGHINGESQVAITARDVDLRGPIHGTKTQVTVALSKSGRLKFHRIDGSVRLLYKSLDPAGPAPIIDAGKIVANAQFKKID